MRFSLMFCTYLLSFFYIIFLTILYFSKARLDNIENKIYKALLITNIFGLITQISCEILSIFQVEIITDIITKILLVYFIVWLSLFFQYVLEISTKQKKLVTSINIFIVIISAFAVAILPYDAYFNIKDGIYYTTGLDTKYAYFISIIYCVALFILLLLKHKTISKKKSLPIYLLLIWFMISGMLQYFFPSMTIIVQIETFICLVMYFTIENPDVKMLEQVEIAKIHAEKANRAKSDFLSSMSHEIRTPLNAIVGFSEDIRDYIDSGDIDRIKEDSELILSSSETLLEIVGNIIDISKIESEKLDIIEKVYNPREEIEKLTKVTVTRIGDRPIDFHLSIAEDIPYELIGDSGKVKQVINNLLTNSIKYTEKGEINLRIDCINQDNMSLLKISCRDTGRGIKKENIEKLFTKFERLDIEKNTTTEGTGLGLAITKSLVEMMGGKINVQSRFGEGSIFVAQIPQKIKTLISPSANVKEVKEPIIDAHIEEEARRVRKKSNSIKKVLIVDDNKLNIIVAKKVLDEIVENVDSVMSGQECIDKIASKEKYDVILMDIMMPEMSGETTFKKLKEILGFNTPVIALTADAESTSKSKYLSEGFDDYIAKPFKKDEIKAILDKYSDNSDLIKNDDIEIL